MTQPTTAPPTALTRSVLLRSQPITAGDSTSDREVRDATAGESPVAPVIGRADGHGMIAGPRSRLHAPLVSAESQDTNKAGQRC